MLWISQYKKNFKAQTVIQTTVFSILYEMKSVFSLMCKSCVSSTALGLRVCKVPVLSLMLSAVGWTTAEQNISSFKNDLVWLYTVRMFYLYKLIK